MVSIKTQEEIQIMAEAGHILAEIMKELKGEVKVGVKTEELNRLAESLIFKYKCKPAFKGFGGFPESLCVSINEVIVHGLPSEQEIKDGDIVSLDSGVLYKGFYSDMAFTVPVGNVDFEILRLIKVTNKALKIGIKKLRHGVTTGAVGNTIQRYIESQNLAVVKDLCGHGIGKELHEDPEIPNYGKRREGIKLEEGMVVCLEPMVCLGKGDIKKSKDKFGLETKDGSISAHFEHMIAITRHGSRILTV